MILRVQSYNFFSKHQLPKGKLFSNHLEAKAKFYTFVLSDY